MYRFMFMYAYTDRQIQRYTYTIHTYMHACMHAYIQTLMCIKTDVYPSHSLPPSLSLSLFLAL